MKLQNRNLKPNDRCDGVKLLQAELRQPGFNIGDPEGFFGSTTFRAHIECQEQHDLPATGIMDAKTRVLIAALDTHPLEGFLVNGGLVRPDGSTVEHARVVLLE
jgi:peptidoglycan hydrolase-like protein with peptidoglycan-binding domain